MRKAKRPATFVLVASGRDFCAEPPDERGDNGEVVFKKRTASTAIVPGDR